LPGGDDVIRVDVDNRCDEFDSYRAARVKSLFNAESGANVRVRADLDIEDDGWRIGVVVGPSGSGKSTIGRSLWGGSAFYDAPWPKDAPVVDAIAPGGDFNEVTGALAAVGLGDVPSWLRPYGVLSNGEQFRADLARIVAERPERVVVDEFTSVVDRQIARIGAGAFAKAWRRGTGQAVLLTCHYDVLDWLQPDWVWDTREARFTRGWDQQRPRVDVEVRAGGWELWPIFKSHHYLEAGPMAGAVTYVGFVDGEPVIHLGVGSANAGGRVEARACRMVVMPEWQGAGIGTRFLNHVCDLYLSGGGHLGARPMTTAFHTSHPQLCAALRRDKRWTQVSAVLHGSTRSSPRPR
jgi:GNAT superfamily N-acetyltransferase